MKAKLNNIVDDIPPKTAEAVILHNVKVRNYFFCFDPRKISTQSPKNIKSFDIMVTNVCDIQAFSRERLVDAWGEGGGWYEIQY